jgi:hypothetical protein
MAAWVVWQEYAAEGELGLHRASIAAAADIRNHSLAIT